MLRTYYARGAMIERAQAHGFALVGRSAYYVEMVARAGLIGTTRWPRAQQRSTQRRWPALGRAHRRREQPLRDLTEAANGPRFRPMAKRRVVLTGAAGYVAQRMLPALDERWDVVPIDIKATTSSSQSCA